MHRFREVESKCVSLRCGWNLLGSVGEDRIAAKIHIRILNSCWILQSKPRITRGRPDVTGNHGRVDTVLPRNSVCTGSVTHRVSGYTLHQRAFISPVLGNLFPFLIFITSDG